MTSTAIKVALPLFALLALTRCRPRESLLVGISAIAVSNLYLPFHELPIRGGRPLTLLALMGLAVLYFLAVDIRGGEGLQHRLARVASGYWFGLLALITVLFAYLLLTRDVSYGLTKVRHLIIYSLSPVAVLSLFTPFRRHELRLILFGLGIGALLIAAQLVLSPQEFGTWAVRKSVGEDVHPNNVARNIGLGLPIIVAALVGPRRLSRPGLLGLLGGLFILSAAIIVTGSRGPLLAAVCGIIAFVTFMLLFSRRSHILPRVLTGLTLGAVASVFVYNVYLKEQETFQRILLYTETVGANTSDMSRLQRYRVAWDGFLDSKLVGVGPGGFTSLWRGPPPGGIYDGRDYPHNFLLEIAAEAGLAGVLIVSIMFGCLVFTIIRRQGQLPPEELPYAGLFVALWVYAFINSSVSGDIATNYQMWVLGGLAWLIFTRGIEVPALEAGAPEAGAPEAEIQLIWGQGADPE